MCSCDEAIIASADTNTASGMASIPEELFDASLSEVSVLRWSQHPAVSLAGLRSHRSPRCCADQCCRSLLYVPTYIMRQTTGSYPETRSCHERKNRRFTKSLQYISCLDRRGHGRRLFVRLFTPAERNDGIKIWEQASGMISVSV